MKKTLLLLVFAILGFAVLLLIPDASAESTYELELGDANGDCEKLGGFYDTFFKSCSFHDTTLTLNSNDVLKVDLGMTLTIGGGTLNNYGNIYNGGFIFNKSGGIINNDGTITNGGTFTNDGTIKNNDDGTIDNSGGNLVNEMKGTITNLGAIINNWEMTNEEGATIENSGVIYNYLNGSAYFNNFGNISQICHGQIIGTLPNDHGTIRNILCAGTTNTNIYAIGGEQPTRSQTDGLTDSVYKYTPSFTGPGSWSQVASLPKPTHYPSVATDSSGYIYAMGGSTYPGFDTTAAVYKYTPSSTGSWSPVAALPVPTTQLAAATDSSGNFYVMGGSTGAGYTDSVYKYTPSFTGPGSWTSIPSLIIPTAGLAAATDSNSNVYAIGGSIMTTTGPMPTNAVYKYTPSTDSWTAVASLPVPTTDLAAATDSNGNIYAIGGSVMTTAGPMPTQAVYRYSPSTNIWIPVESLPVPTQELAAATDSQGNIYAIGGTTSSASTDAVYKYTTSTNIWTPVASLPLPTAALAAVGTLQVTSPKIVNFHEPFVLYCELIYCQLSQIFINCDIIDCHWNPNITQYVELPLHPLLKELNSLPIVVYSDKPAYDHNSVIILTGHISNSYKNQSVTLKITNPSGTIVSVNKIPIGSNGHFTTMVNTNSSQISKNGVYTIYVQQGNLQSNTFQTAFVVTSTIPEFDSMVGIILILSIVSVIVVSRKFEFAHL